MIFASKTVFSLILIILHDILILKNVECAIFIADNIHLIFKILKNHDNERLFIDFIYIMQEFPYVIPLQYQIDADSFYTMI